MNTDSKGNFSTLDIDALGRFEQQAILDYLLYTMSQEQRDKLMQRFPDQYNRLCGREIMVSRNEVK